MIKTFIDLDDALDYVGYTYQNDEYFKVEIYKLDDGRWRVGIITTQQLELDF